MSEKKLSPYKSKSVNIQFARNLISISNKLFYGVLAVPITYLLNQENNLSWVNQYILIGATLTLCAISMQKRGYKILEENITEQS